MLSESGARVSPVCIALYSSVICRKIGSAIIAPPSVTFCSSCPEIPVVKCGNLKRPGSSSVSLPVTLAAHEPPGEQRERDRADRDQQADELAAFLPDEDAEHEPAHPDHREDRPDEVDLPRPRVGDVVDELDLGQHDRDHDDLEPEADAPGQVAS